MIVRMGTLHCIPDTSTAGAVPSGTVGTGVAGTRMASRGVAVGLSLFSRSSSGVLTGDTTASVAAGVSCAISTTAHTRLLLVRWRFLMCREMTSKLDADSLLEVHSVAQKAAAK